MKATKTITCTDSGICVINKWFELFKSLIYLEKSNGPTEVSKITYMEQKQMMQPVKTKLEWSTPLKLHL